MNLDQWLNKMWILTMGTIQQTRMHVRVVDLVPYFKKNYVAKKLCSNPERILIYQGFGTFI